MQPGDRAEFDGQLRTLFSGLRITAFDNPQQVTERVEAWWAGLQRMSLPLFVRCIEHLVGNPWPDYLPKKREDTIPNDLWKVAKQLRGGSAEAQQPGGANHIRSYWRSVIVHDFARCLGHTVASFEPVLIQHKATLGVSMLALLNELEQQERRDGRTEGQHRYVMRMAEQFARSSPGLCTERAPILPPAAAGAEPELAF